MQASRCRDLLFKATTRLTASLAWLASCSGHGARPQILKNLGGSMDSGSKYVRAFALACVLTTIPPAWTQERFGQISGIASDPSGAVLPNVNVAITNKATQRVFTTRTGANGEYVAYDLEPGRYALRFEHSGFNPFEVPDVNLLVGKSLRVDASLQLSTAQTTVEVSEE